MLGQMKKVESKNDSDRKCKQLHKISGLEHVSIVGRPNSRCKQKLASTGKTVFWHNSFLWKKHKEYRDRVVRVTKANDDGNVGRNGDGDKRSAE